MAAIVDDDIKAAHFSNNPLQKCGVSLRSDANLSILTIEGCAGRIDIHTKDGGVRAKVLAPQSQRSASKNANFQKSKILVPERCKMLMIDL